MIYFSILSSYQIYIEWQNQPVLTTIGTTGLPVEKIKFPSITICGQGSSKDILDKAMFRQLSNYLAEKGINTTGKSKEEVSISFRIIFKSDSMFCIIVNKIE